MLLLARNSHPGHSVASSSSGGSSSAQAGDEANDDGFDFGSGSIAPSTAAPQAQTSVS